MSRRSRRRKSSPEKYALLWTILADAGLSSAAKCVAVVLLLKYRNHATGQCNPSFAALATALGRTRRAIIPAVQELRNRGWIKVHSTAGGSSTNTNRITFCADLPEGEPVKSTSPQGVKPASPVKQNAEGVKSASHEPSRTTTTNVVDEEDRARERAPDGALGQVLASGFEEFWEAYPWRVDENKCREEFDRILTAGRATAEEIIAGALRYREETAGRDPDFIAYPLNWLKGERWRDEARPKPNGAYRPQQRRGGRQSMFEATIEGSNLDEGDFL